MSLYENILNRIHIVHGDITQMDTDAIVNAANTSLLGGGGVDVAIRRAAGADLLKECRSIGPCPTGEARITGGYHLKTRYVIHTPGPVYHGGKSGEKNLLISNYVHSMDLAKKNNLQSISFPAISTGVYRYPKKEAAETAITTIIEYMKNNRYYPDIFFVLFDNENFDIYQSVFSRLTQELPI